MLPSTASMRKDPSRFIVLGLTAVAFISACGPSAGPSSSSPLIRTLDGHSLWVSSIAWSSDGTRLASGSYDTTVRIWDVDGGRVTSTLTNFNGSVVSLGWSPDNKYLATGSTEPSHTVRVWRTADWKAVLSLSPSNQYSVENVAWSPDSKRLAVGVGNLLVFDATTGEVLARLNPDGGVHSVAWSPDGTRLAFGSTRDPHRGDKGIVIVWNPQDASDPDSNNNPVMFNGHEGIVTSVAWSPDSKQIASGSDANTIKFWDVPSEQNTATLSGHSATVQSLAWSPDGTRLASGSWDNTVKIWDVTRKQNIETFQHPNVVRSISWSPDSTRLASACDDGKVRIWKVK
jgi:WD40 repeat protein